MKRRVSAVFLDRDGTINVDYGYVYEKEKLQFIDGAVQGLKLLQAAGYKLIIVTNQSGIARGFFSIEQMEEFHKNMLDKLAEEGVVISRIYYCPHLNGCECRKPQLKLFYQAQKEFDLDFAKSYVIGDKLRDLALCEKEPVKGYLINAEKKIIAKDKNIIICNNLLSAAKDIVGFKNHESY